MRRLLLLLTLIALTGCPRQEGEAGNRVAAVVNDEVILLSELDARAAPELKKAPAQDSPQALGEWRQRVLRTELDTLIDEKLLQGEAERQGITVDEKEVDLAIEEVKRQNGFTGKEGDRLEEILGQQGYTLPTYRDYLRESLRKSKLINLMTVGKIRVSDQDLKDDYQKWRQTQQEAVEVHLRCIEVRLSASPSPAELDTAEKKAAALARQARKPGVDFAKLATKKSDHASAGDGGDLGWFHRGELLPQVETLAFGMKPGEVADPLRVPAGFYVLKVEERRTGAVKPFDQVKDELRERRIEAQREKYTEEYLHGLRQAARIEVRLSPVEPQAPGTEVR